MSRAAGGSAQAHRGSRRRPDVDVVERLRRSLGWRQVPVLTAVSVAMVAVSVLVVPTFALSNSDVFTALMTHGFLLAAVLARALRGGREGAALTRVSAGDDDREPSPLDASPS